MEIFSEHLKRQHLLLRIDARVKLTISGILLAMIISSKGFLFPLLILCLSTASTLAIKVPVRVLLIRFSEPLFIALVLVMLKFFFSGNETLFSIDIADIAIKGHMDGLIEGLQIGSKMLGAVSVIALLGFSTPFSEIISALSWFKVPKGCIEILIFAYRYIFVLLEDAMIIYNAQKNRLGYCGIKRGLTSFGTLAGSLVIKAFEHSQNTAIAMAQRGYDGNMPMLKHKPFKLKDIVASILVVVLVGFLWKI